MLKFNVTGDKLHLESYNSLNSGSYGYYIAEFKFDSDWDGLIPHIAIIENGVQRVEEVIIDNTFKITTTESGVMMIGVYGIDMTDCKRITTNFVCVEVKNGAYIGSHYMPKDIWSEYHTTVLGYMKSAEGAAADAKVSAEKAKKAESNIKNLSVTATEGKTVSVVQTTTEEGISLALTLPRGPQGYTPQKGTDYWTEADKAEIKGYVEEAILGGAW